ncbi:hypothetical protein [Shumkonia mesophila]|uniref:hypothetical protein n=1 Tax=Shumkonia mesophila TaxID=2838854 RepID=UPI0029352225|nr:hypothetical protein [Shumkonia mesophila]
MTTETARQGRTKKRSVGADLVIPIMAAGYALYYIYTVLDYPTEAQINGLFLGIVLCLLVVVLLARVAAQWFRGEVDFGMQRLLAPLSMIPSRLVFLGLTIAYIVVIPWFGFTLTTFLFVLGSLLALGVRSKKLLVLMPLLSAAGGYIFFIAMLNTRFPKGPVEHFLAGMF